MYVLERIVNDSSIGYVLARGVTESAEFSGESASRSEYLVRIDLSLRDKVDGVFVNCLFGSDVDFLSSHNDLVSVLSQLVGRYDGSLLSVDGSLGPLVREIFREALGVV